jgi:hypothetical protein
MSTRSDSISSRVPSVAVTSTDRIITVDVERLPSTQEPTEGIELVPPADSDDIPDKQEPGVLPRSKPLFEKVVLGVWDQLLVVSPLVFILLGIIAKYLDGKSAVTSTFGKDIIEATKLVQFPTYTCIDSRVLLSILWFSLSSSVMFWNSPRHGSSREEGRSCFWSKY